MTDQMTDSKVSRTQYSSRNAATSIIGQVLSNVLRFVCRTVFIYTLGREYLGISSLYTNILTLLSITELGFGSAVTYSLYKPLANDDRETIAALMNFYRKAYRIIGLAILGIGLAITPLLPRLMTGVTDKVNIYEYYFLYLAQTVVSYLFFAYKSTLILADQKKYIYDLIDYAAQIVMLCVQILVLIFLRSFFLYTVLSIVRTILFNIIVAAVVDRRYPYIRNRRARLDEAGRKDIFTRVYAMSLYKISSAVGTATDNLIISSFIGVVMVGMYDNYYSIISVFMVLLTNLFKSFSASLGNLYATESREKNEFVFRSLNLFNNLLVSVISVCFLVIFQPFIRLWIGPDYLLPDSVLFIIVMNFATNYLQNMVQIDREVTGVFVRGKYRAVATAVLNLVISILLVKVMGLGGVFLGSIISRMLTTGVYDPWLLYHDGFHKSCGSFFRDFLLAIGIICGCGWGINAAFSRISFHGVTGTIVNLVLRLMLGVLLPSLCYYLIYGRSRYAAYMKEKILGMVRSRKRGGRQREK